METKNENKEIATQTMYQGDAMMATLFNPAAFEQAQRAATLFSKSGLVPKQFENNMPACFVGLQLAAQLGVNPFMLFQKIYVVQGKIGIEAQVAIAVANQRGVFSGPIEHLFSGEGKTRSCTATAILSKSKKPVTMTIGWDVVEAEGWNKKGGSKWLTMPDQMFRYRTSLWLIRTYAPETLMGLNSIDEIEDSTIIDITPAKHEEKPVETMAAKLEKAKTKKQSAEDPAEKAALISALSALPPEFLAKAKEKNKVENIELPAMGKSFLEILLKDANAIADAAADEERFA